jgi:hypothetical protein
MTPEPDRPAPAPSPLADRLADLQGSAEWIDARQLTPVIDHAERVEAEMTAARREATTLRAALEEIARLEPLGSGMKLIVHGSSAREVALAAMAAGLPPDGRPAGDAGEPPAAPGIDAQRGGTPAVGASIYAGRLGMNLDVGPEMIAFRRSLDRPGDAQAQFEAAVSRLVEHDRAGPTVAALHQAIQVAANLMAAWAEDLEAGGDEAEIIDHMRCAAREARAVIGVPKSVIDAGSDSPDPAPAALRAQAEDYRAKWEDALTRLDAVTGTLALYGRRAEAGRELARAVVDATGTRDAFADLRATALRVLARPIGGRDGGEAPEKAPQSPPDAMAPPPADPDESGPSDRTTGLPGALAGASPGPSSRRACPEKAEMRGKLTNCRVGKMPANMRAGAAFADDGLPFPENRYGIPMVLMDLLRDGADAIDGLLAAWDRRAEAVAAPGDAPAAGAVERAAERILAVIDPELAGTTEDGFDDRFRVMLSAAGQGFRVDDPRAFALKVIADLIRAELGLVPAAGDAIEKGHAPS